MNVVQVNNLHYRTFVLTECCRTRDPAMPPDVRKRSALPSCGRKLGLRPNKLGIAQNSEAALPEGQRPSAHQTAEPVFFGKTVRHMTQEYDVIVIGGGHNGLVNAAYLARAGKTRAGARAASRARRRGRD